jgi:RimJ/RimL family protein N-acetyltransferase
MARHASDLPTSDLVLRDVTDDDLPIFFAHQLDPEATQMAAFPARDWDAFMAHWNRIRRDATAMNRTILVGGQVAGNIASFEQDGRREVGYWIGRTFWGKGVATSALAAFLGLEPARPLYAHVARHNIASRRVLEKCGFTVAGESSVGDDGVEELLLKLDAGRRDGMR